MDGKLKDHVLAGEALVAGGKCVELVLERCVVLCVEETRLAGVHLVDARAVRLLAGALADDFGGEHEVFQEFLVHAGQGARAGAHLLDARGAGRGAQDAALGAEHDVGVGKLLLELAHQFGLDLVEALQERHGHKDHEGAAALHVDLFASGELQALELLLEVALLEGREVLGQGGLEGRDGRARGLEDFCVHVGERKPSSHFSW